MAIAEILGLLGGVAGAGASLWNASQQRKTDEERYQDELAWKQKEFEEGKISRDELLAWQKEMFNRNFAYKEAGDQEDRTRRASRQAYLGQNLQAFEAPEYKFDPSKYSDVLNPIKEQNDMAMQKLINMRALQGVGRSNVTGELAARQANRGAQNMQGVLTKLAREGEDTSYNRALKEYLADVERKKTIASAY